MSQAYRSRPDYILLFIVAALLSVGVLMVFSASPTMAFRLGDSYYYLKRHLIAVALGCLAMYGGFRTDMRSLKNSAAFLVALSLILLLVVFIPGIGFGVLGARRWIYLGLLSFQPAELAKFALIVYMAKELSSKPLKEALWPVLGVTLAMALFIIKQPDLGTAMVILITSFSMLYIAGIPAAQIMSVAAAGFVGIVLLSITKSYRMKRLLAYVNPWNDPHGVGFHIIQSLIAVGSGGLFGLGLGQSKQKFFYLPQNYTDFIFAIFCEEMGLIGALVVVLLFFVFIARGIRAVRNSSDNFSMLLAAGIVSWIGFQALLNISVVLGLLPTTGIPLPFISYGGTSIVVMLYSVGVLLNVSQGRRAEA